MFNDQNIAFRTQLFLILGFGILVIGICPSTPLRVVSLSNHL
jgi:hypothetical protein